MYGNGRGARKTPKKQRPLGASRFSGANVCAPFGKSRPGACKASPSQRSRGFSGFCRAALCSAKKGHRQTVPPFGRRYLSDMALLSPSRQKNPMRLAHVGGYKIHAAHEGEALSVQLPCKGRKPGAPHFFTMRPCIIENPVLSKASPAGSTGFL